MDLDVWDIDVLWLVYYKRKAVSFSLNALSRKICGFIYHVKREQEIVLLRAFSEKGIKLFS